MTPTILLGGRDYRWRGKFIQTISKNNTSYVSMDREDSVIISPCAIVPNTQYLITISARKNDGNGSLLINFFGKRNYDGPHIPINIKNSEQKKYTVSVISPRVPESTPMYFRVFRPNNATGTVFIENISITLAHEKIKIPRRPKLLIKEQIDSNAKLEKDCEKLLSMGKKIVVYFVSRIEQKRVFQYVNIENDDLLHVFLLPPEITITNSKFKYEENYDDFGTKNVLLGNSISDFQSVVDMLKPSIFVCGTLPNFYQIKLPEECKKVFVSHGMVGKHVYAIKELKKYSGRWHGCDLYCGVGRYLEGFIEFMTNKKQKIAKNIMPQFDIIYHDKNKFIEFKDKISNDFNIHGFDKYILFAGFGGSTRSDFKYHNVDYYRTSVYLEKIAKKNNWFVFIKPRLEPEKDIDFVTYNEYLKEFKDDYKNLFNSQNVCMVHRLESIYKYFFCDAIVSNGVSTTEIEACCANKPLVIVRTEDFYDPLDTVRIGAAMHVSGNSIGLLENSIKEALYYPYKFIYGRQKILDFHEMVFDGKMGVRLYKEIVKLSNE